MRKVQINIKMTMVNDQSINGKIEEVSVYADGNNIWEVICAGFDKLLQSIKENGRSLPVFGRKEHY